MADSSSLYSTATSSRPLLGDDDGASLKTTQTATTAGHAADDRASVYTADTTLAPAPKLPTFSLDPFDPPIGFSAAYVRSEPTTLALAEASSSILGCVPGCLLVELGAGRTLLTSGRLPSSPPPITPVFPHAARRSPCAT